MSKEQFPSCTPQVSLHDPQMPGWSEIANDLVVQEKVCFRSHARSHDVARLEIQNSAAQTCHRAWGLYRAPHTLLFCRQRSAAGVQFSHSTSPPVSATKVLLGSRCGPIDVALKMLGESPEIRTLAGKMTSFELPLEQGVEGMRLAAQKGVLKVQLLC